MITIVWSLVKVLGPYLVIVCVLIAAFVAGGYTVQKKWDKQDAQIRAESNQLITTAQTKADDARKTAEISAQIIGETYDKNTQLGKELSSSNDVILSERLFHSKSNSNRCTVPSNSTSTKTNDDSVARSWVVPEKAAREINDDTKYADEIIENCRAMQTYIKSLEVIR